MVLKQCLIAFSLMSFATALDERPLKKPTGPVDSKCNHCPKIPCAPKKVQDNKKFTPQSCLDYLKNGYKCNGHYKIYLGDTQESTLTVYCDMNSEAGAAWTLIESFTLANKDMKEFTTTPFKINAPVNENSPDWKLYRMSLVQMNHIRAQSTHWRSTCSFPNHGVDYTDYVRGKFAEFDILTFLGSGVCKKVEFVNIRGHRCAHCTSQWWQVLNKYGPAIDSSATGCQFKPNKGAVISEDNFGVYAFINKKFRCTSSPTSTTNWWFGGYQ